MPTSKLINYTTREFMSDNELELYAKKQDEIFTPKVIEEFKKAGMLRRVLTRIWNKEGVARVGILFEYKDEKAFVACQTLLDKYHAPQVKTFVNKVVGSRGIVLHEFTSEDFNWTQKTFISHLAISLYLRFGFATNGVVYYNFGI